MYPRRVTHRACPLAQSQTSSFAPTPFFRRHEAQPAMRDDSISRKIRRKITLFAVFIGLSSKVGSESGLSPKKNSGRRRDIAIIPPARSITMLIVHRGFRRTLPTDAAKIIRAPEWFCDRQLGGSSPRLLRGRSNNSAGGVDFGKQKVINL